MLNFTSAKKTSKKMNPQLNSHPLETGEILRQIFNYLEDSVQDQISFRSVKGSWATPTFPDWRNQATVVIKQNSKLPEDGQPRTGFLNEFQNIIRPPYDPNCLLSKPFRRYKIITECDSSKFLASYFGNHGNDFRKLAPRKVVNFWRMCGPHMSHLTLQNIHIQNKQSLVKLLNALLFEACPSLNKLSLEPSSYYIYKVAIIYDENEDYVLPEYKPSLLTSFSFRVGRNHPAFNDWNVEDNLKAIFCLMPSLTELTLEGNPVKMIKGLQYPVTISGDFIKLQKLSFFGYGCSAFHNLNEYVNLANPPLTSLTASISYQTDFSAMDFAAFGLFFEERAAHLTQLTLNVQLNPLRDTTMDYFMLLFEPQFDFPNLIDFHVIFEKDSENVSFDFRLFRKMPELRKFSCKTDAFNGTTIDGLFTRNPSILRKFVSPETRRFPNESGRFSRYLEFPLRRNPTDPLDLGNLTHFSFRLNYKFEKYAIQQLKDWAGNLRNLEIVVDDQEECLHFLGKEFQWWRNSLDKVVLHYEKDLTDYETITKAIRWKANQGEVEDGERDVQIQFVKLPVGTDE